jgi:hypothetical protein
MYKTTEIQDVSRPICKRYVAHVEVDKKNKTAVKRMIEDATDEVRKSNNPVHVVWLYVWRKGKLMCRTMWVDKTFTEAPLPKPLKFNDHIGEIGIVWM